MIDHKKIYNATELMALPSDDLMTNMIKYVRIGNEFRFCTGMVYICLSHKDLVKASEIPISAGMIIIYPEFVKMINNHSETLNIGVDADDGELLSKLFNRPFKAKTENFKMTDSEADNFVENLGLI